MPSGIRAPDLPATFAWLNTDRPLRLSKELKGHVVLLDFWTYCCINCMHVLPMLDRIENKFADEPFVIVGVHSAKFENEASPATIRAAIQRYDIRHPVIVDEHMRLWNEYTINSWPTLVLIGADGRIIGGVSGEGHEQALIASIKKALADAKASGTLAAQRVQYKTDGQVQSATGLAFPGKVLADAAGQRLFIADSNHNRIVITTWPDAEGHASVKEIIGSGAAGAKDGSYAKASFLRPQGLALAGDLLWVADTDNQLIRQVDLAKQTVTTVLGTGLQVWDHEGGKSGRQQSLNSPWDVAIDGNRLYIAMAGDHQIWNANIKTWDVRPMAGSGAENIADGPAETARLAQTSHMALDAARRRLYFADSETSSIRYLDLATHEVHTIIGHGLFDFGDIDGNAETARLQHPLGVALFGKELLVADTYNHKIKMIDPDARTARTFDGTGQPGSGTPGGKLALFEPASVAVSGDTIFIADTNNHRIVMQNAQTKAWQVLTISGLSPEGEAMNSALDPAARDKTIAAPAVAVSQTNDIELQISPALPTGTHFGPGAPARITVRDARGVLVEKTFKELTSSPVKITVPHDKAQPGAWTVRLDYAYCTTGDTSVCIPATVAWSVPVASGGTAQSIALRQ